MTIKEEAEPVGIVAMVKKNYPNCLVVPYSKLVTSGHAFRPA